MEFLLERDCNSAYLADYLKTLYNNETSYDILLLSEGAHFKAHRCILAAVSNFFNYILKEYIGNEVCVSLVGYR